jgi:hypothetical protein
VTTVPDIGLLSFSRTSGILAAVAGGKDSPVLAPGKVKLTDGKWNVVAAASTLFPIAVV